MGKSLREVAQVLAVGAQFLRIEAQVVGISEGLFEQEPCALQVPAARHAFHEPEGADAEGSLAARQTVRHLLRAVPVDQRVVHQVLVDGP